MYCMNKNRKIAFLEILLFIIIVVLNGINILPISSTIYLLVLVWITMKIQKETREKIGLTIGRRSLVQSILVGIFLGIILELFATYFTTPLLSQFFGVQPNLSEFQMVKGNFLLLLFFLFISWALAAFGEEICYRGFLMNRVAILFGQNKLAWALSLIFSCVLFGWGHTEQGITGWIQEGLNGFFLGIIFFASGKNLAIPIVTHGVSNTLAFVLIYLGKYPGIF